MIIIKIMIVFKVEVNRDVVVIRRVELVLWKESLVGDVVLFLVSV